MNAPAVEIVTEREARVAAMRDAGAWSDLFLCLSRAWLPPPADIDAAHWCLALAGDLEDLGGELGADFDGAVGALRERAGHDEPADRWLVVYSRLFLVPPVPVTLNTGIYLEGALGGSAAQMMQACYQAAGFAARKGFRDLPDHVAMQLEFVAALFDRAHGGDALAADQAREFLAGFVDHWAEPLRNACERAIARDPAAGVFAQLASALESAVAALR